MNKKSLKLVSAMLFLSGLPSGYIQTALGTTVAGIQVIQQNGTCTGIVTDQNGETVIGASVVVKGTTNGTISGLDGDFSIPSVKIGQRKRYFQGVFYGGRTREILLLSDWCRETITQDFNKKSWHAFMMNPILTTTYWIRDLK